MNHVSVVAHDLESIRFYVDVLGLEPVPDADVPASRCGGSGGRPPGAPLRAPGRAADPRPLRLAVDDIVAVYERARELGILDRRFGYAIAELPGGEAQLYVRDPSGNLLELDHPDGAAARERIEEMILSASVPQPDGPVPRLFLTA